MFGIRKPGDTEQLIVPEYSLHIGEERPANEVQELNMLGLAEQLLELVEPVESVSPLMEQSVEQIVQFHGHHGSSLLDQP